MKKFKLVAAAALMTMMLTFPAYATSFDISPGRPDTPVVEELPDPEDPDSPERVTIIEEGVPKTYIKFQNPDGTYIYILEEDVPLAGIKSPQTSDSSGALAGAAALASGLGAAVFLAADKMKKA